MPAKSRAQLRFLFAAEARGELPSGTASAWAQHTPNLAELPEHATAKKKRRSKAAALGDQAALLFHRDPVLTIQAPAFQGWDKAAVVAYFQALAHAARR